VEGTTPVAGGAVGLAVLSRGVVLVVDGVGRAGAEVDVGLRHAKELVYVLDRRPCTSRSALQAYSSNVVTYSL
jgi:hypothetical protein